VGKSRPIARKKAPVLPGLLVPFGAQADPLRGFRPI
jgi:hypothetical protein